MRTMRGFGRVTHEDRRAADRFFESLMGGPTIGAAPHRGGVRRRRDFRGDEAEAFEAFEQVPPSAPPAPYLPAGGRSFAPQPGTFNCAAAGITVIPASFLPQRTTDPNAAVDAALTAAGLDAAARGRIIRAGLLPIATEFGGAALTELVARLRWSARDIEAWGRRGHDELVQRLLIHIPGHFRELARRAPDAREAFVLECLGWLLMVHIRDAVAAATGSRWWVPPAPGFVTAVPNPVPALSAGVSQLLLRYLLVDTTMTAGEWNARLTTWGNGLPGRQWQAERDAPQPGRPFYAGLVTVPAHVPTATPRAAFTTAWTRRVADTDARFAPMAAGAATVTLDGLRNAAALRECENSSAHLPAGAMPSLTLRGLELAYDFPMTHGRRAIRALPLMAQLHPVYTALFQTIAALGWNDLLYQTSGGGCFRGIKHPAAARITVAGRPVTIDPFHAPDATKVTQINTLFTPAERAAVVAAARTARRMSEHGLGAAIDFNVPENAQDDARRPFGSMDPRIIAVFEAFHFRFGACFSPTDPMHFEYCAAPCAPAAANLGTLGPVVTPSMLLPAAATGTMIA